MMMQLSNFDDAQLFSITAWKSADGWTVGVQALAGDPVKYVTRKNLSDALAFFLKPTVDIQRLPPAPYGAA